MTDGLPDGEPRGVPDAIVRPRAAQEAIDVRRIAPSTWLADVVDYFWLVRWNVPEPFEQQIIPQPRIHLAAESGRLLVHGVSRAPFFRTLRGTGHVLGAAFHPAGFRPVLGSSVGAISDTVGPAADLLGQDDRPVAQRILDPESTDGEVVEALEAYLERVGHRADPEATRINSLVAEAEQDSSITRADTLAALAGVSLRTLQRTFTEYVGVGPKWVIQRFRLLDAAAAAHRGRDLDWAALAVELGFSDQAHLTRVFTQVVGTPPATYARDRTVR